MLGCLKFGVSRVGRGAGIVDTAVAVSGEGAEVELVYPEKGVKSLTGILKPGPPQPSQLEAFKAAGGTESFLTFLLLLSSFAHYEGHAPGSLSQNPGRTGSRRQEIQYAGRRLPAVPG